MQVDLCDDERARYDETRRDAEITERPPRRQDVRTAGTPRRNSEALGGGAYRKRLIPAAY